MDEDSVTASPEPTLESKVDLLAKQLEILLDDKQKLEKEVIELRKKLKEPVILSKRNEKKVAEVELSQWSAADAILALRDLGWF